MLILAIESSCDETAVAVTRGREDLSSVIATQIEEHKIYGGVVPEIASRRHAEAISGVVEKALEDADCTLDTIDAVAVTKEPGLIGSLMVGINTAKTISCYADIIAMRHPKEGAPLVAAMNATIPVINAGDGGHNHPTQTLADLLTIKREKGGFDNLTVGLCGDLKFGRTVHSLINALSRYSGIKFVLISPEELKLPSYVKKDVIQKNNLEYVQTTDLESVMPELDILYMTRVQRERFFNEADYLRLKDSYILTPEKLKNAKDDLCIMHPLPRVNEISVAIDDDKRACYFKQVLNGKYMRMALILKLLEVL